jgi:hypothetical protein
MYTDEEFFEKLNSLINRQLNDLEKALRAEADVLCLVGCCNLIEFIGGIWNGKLGKPRYMKPRFIDGVKLLGGTWSGEITGEGQRQVSEVTIRGRTFKGDFILKEQKREGVTVTEIQQWGDHAFGEEAMLELRNTLTHQYIAFAQDKTRSFPMIAIEGLKKVTWIIDSKALQPGEGKSSHVLPINIRKLIKAIKEARKKLISELESNEAQRNTAKEALFNLPTLKEKLE